MTVEIEQSLISFKRQLKFLQGGWHRDSVRGGRSPRCGRTRDNIAGDFAHRIERRGCANSDVERVEFARLAMREIGQARR